MGSKGRKNVKKPKKEVAEKKAAKVEKGSPEPNRQKVAMVSREEVKKIAETKMADLNAADLEGAIRMVEGTARSMGITIQE